MHGIPENKLGLTNRVDHYKHSTFDKIFFPEIFILLQCGFISPISGNYKCFLEVKWCNGGVRDVNCLCFATIGEDK